VNSGAHEGEAVPASYMTPAMLLVYTFNTCWTPIYATNIKETWSLLQTSGGKDERT